MYLYKSIIYHNTDSVTGIDTTQNALDVSDFETNNKDDAVPVESVTISETTFILDRSYTDFDALIADGITWGNVKYVDDGLRYIMYLISNNPLE